MLCSSGHFYVQKLQRSASCFRLGWRTTLSRWRSCSTLPSQKVISFSLQRVREFVFLTIFHTKRQKCVCAPPRSPPFKKKIKKRCSFWFRKEKHRNPSVNEKLFSHKVNSWAFTGEKGMNLWEMFRS
uniref:Uncharacterized protein n=1 Tax=Oryzias latipes TaxID=8090 RepID=A0A3B3IHJ4_ORYLA